MKKKITKIDFIVLFFLKQMIMNCLIIKGRYHMLVGMSDMFTKLVHYCSEESLRRVLYAV